MSAFSKQTANMAMEEIRYYYICHPNYVTIILPNPKKVLDQIQ